MRSRLFLLLMAGLAACEPTADDAPTPSSGAADFSRYVAFGDDYSAGVYNGSLTRASQEFAFSNLMARQLQRANGGSFTQPLLDANERLGPGLSLLSLTERNLPLLGPVAASSADSIRVGTGACSELRYKYPDWSSAAGGLPADLSAPGLRLLDTRVPGIGNGASRPTGSYNAAIDRMLQEGDVRSYRQLASDARPTFFTVFLGLSDFMPYILSNGGCTPLPTKDALVKRMQGLVDTTLVGSGAKGLILQLPELTSLPLTQTTVTIVNQRFGRNDTASLYATIGGTKTRLQARDVVLLPMVGRIGRNETATGQPAAAPFGSIDNPLRERDVLTAAKLNSANAVIRLFNDDLRIKFGHNNDRPNTAIVPTATFFSNITGKGAFIDGIRYNGNPVTGGVFGYDGISLTPRGNALLVNEAIDVLNDPTLGFGAHVPRLDASQFPATPLP